ncbi:hypothetical protein [Halogranum rubrum]|uniref:Uncharacterized protein n=1 Tax=Halogranum salarium B-1 TaxID=1210908 RepID=J3JHC7_9EURY|nr:hypothetical protein [Halogranum salarium]EJN60871.1 hypothetical protein HSB1_14740 [Halogranum salarium B-1]
MSSGLDDDVDADAESQTEIETHGDSDIGTANTMLDRADESRIKLVVLLSANRLLITGALALGFFVAFMVLGQFYYPDFQADIQSGDTIETIFSTMLGAIITGTTLVVTITQLVISQENGPLGDQHARMSNTMDFRSYASELLEQPVPADPSAFLRVLVDATQKRARALRDAVSGNDNDQLRDELDEFTDSLTGNADEVRDELDGARFGTFDVLFAALDFNYGWKIFQVERMMYEYDDALSTDQRQLFEELKTSLSMFGPAREHIKTLYFQWALIDLSQLILYAAVPALVVTGGMLAFVGSDSVTGVTFGIENILWVVDAAFTISLLPFLLLVSYIARIATIAKRTLAIGPLILRDSQR